MNKIYKVVKNQSGKQAVASELAKGKRKGIAISLGAMLISVSLSLYSSHSLAKTINEGDNNTIANSDDHVIAIGNGNSISNAYRATVVGNYQTLSMEKTTLINTNHGNMLIGSDSSVKGNGIQNSIIGYGGHINNGTGINIIGNNGNVTNSKNSTMIGSSSFSKIDESSRVNVIGSGNVDKSTGINLISNNFLSTVSNSSNINVIGESVRVLNSQNTDVLGGGASVVNSTNSSVIGRQSTVKNSSESLAFGAYANVTDSNNSVALGSGSFVTKQDNVISVGAGNSSILGYVKTRKIINVTAGNLNSNSNDAVIGSQLHATNKEVEKLSQNQTTLSGKVEDIVKRVDKTQSEIATLKATIDTANQRSLLATNAANAAQTTATQAGTDAGNAILTAREAKTTAESATRAATTAGQTADRAQATATRASTTALQASITAGNAEQLAQEAKEKAEKAQTGLVTANAEIAKVSANQTALTEKTNANEQAINGLTGRVANVETSVQTAQGKADNAVTQSIEAKATAEQANNNASQAKTEAQTALNTANTANAHANSALTQAKSAVKTAQDNTALANQAIAKAENAERTATNVQTVASEAKTNAETAIERATLANTQSAQALNQANTANDKADNAVSASQQAVQKVDLVAAQVEKHDTQINAVQTSLAETAQKAEQAELVGIQARHLGENALSQAKSVSNRVETLEQRTVQYNADKSAVSLNNATLNDLADGEVSATSTQAVTGKQLHATEQKMEKVVQELLVPVQKQVADTKAEVASNKAEITTNKANIAKNTQRVEKLVEVANAQTVRINENTRFVQAQAERITRNTQAINENRQAIQKNSRRIDNLEQQSRKDRRQARAGVAGAMAMTQITPVQGKTFTIGAGVGTYRGETAVAVGVKYAPKPNVVISLSGSADSRGGVGAATGVSLGLN
ncbi:YadA-like family protein [Haemophilus parahaemolyticus]|uniref:YadA-like family protein n=1 Tax=Haemophilus parahaemolyticus TaxID=735 RepID=UPI0028D8B255|nr:YadA-like family protein [Haemophilus parahaemolyticus]